MDMELIKVFINNKFQGTIECSNCGNTRVLNMLKYSGRFINMGDKTLKVKCKCNHVAEVICEFRKFPRIKVNLKGMLRKPGTHENVGTVTIDSLSLGGIGFFLHARLAVQKGNVFELVFTLDDAEQTVIQEDIMVIRTAGNYLGAEFRDKHSYNYELDFYIANYYENLELACPMV